MKLSWDPDFYKTGYEGFESLENFPTREGLEDYRRLLLDKTRAQVTFLARLLGTERHRVLEFGSGNGRLLVALAEQGMIRKGLGIEISRSRVQFAEQWAADGGFSTLIRNVAADALEYECPAGEFNLAVCITGAFGYMRPIHENAPGTLLDKAHAALEPGGHLLLELYQMSEERRQMLALNDGKLRVWQPLPPENSFIYYLDDLEYCSERRILRHEKIFIGRNGTIDAGRVHVVSYYSDQELIALLGEHGFQVERTMADFQDTLYVEGQSACLVILAKRFN